MKRVVITGVGVISPLGMNMKTLWDNIINSRCGISTIENVDTSGLSVHIAGEIKEKNGSDDVRHNAMNFADHFPVKDIKKVDKFMIYAMAACEEALTQAGWKPTREEDLLRTAVTIGSGIGGLKAIEDTVLKMKDKGADRVSPFFIPASLINLASGHVSIKYGFLGPNHAVVTACATGAHAIYNAAQMIQSDDADVVVCGGAESAVCATGLAGFAAARALSTKFNDTPTKASRPWDKDRDGFVMSEGAGVLVVEEYEHAKKRGANILAEYISAGLSGDAYHITAPESTGRGARNAMKIAIKKSGLSPDQIGYINAHGTSTPLGDMIELRAVDEVFRPYYTDKKILMSSTKSATGHLLGAAGSLEAALSIKAFETGIIPPTLNLDNPEDGTEGFDLVPHKAIERNVDHILSNSFGFGGTNISLIFSKFKG